MTIGWVFFIIGTNANAWDNYCNVNVQIYQLKLLFISVGIKKKEYRLEVNRWDGIGEGCN
ncbi:hypothetical protein CN490_24880 [Bacillus cereus]|nr:hypothetical protein CN490_24880 [Bacillus cereus]